MINRQSFTYAILAALLVACAGNQTATESPTDDETTKSLEWTMVWSDEFDGDSLNMKNWSYQVEPAGRFNDEWQAYRADKRNAYVEDGSLVIKAIHESETHGMNQYSSARLHTANKQSWKYGKISARIKLPFSEGIWPAFWMLGANIDENGGDTPWPQCGEIDIFELYGSHDDAVVEANMHYSDKEEKHGMMGAKSYKLKEGIFADEYHVFDLIWTQDSMSWFVDGELYASTDITADEYSEFHKEFFLLLNVAVGGTWAGRPGEDSIFPQYMYVDWVRVYQEAS